MSGASSLPSSVEGWAEDVARRGADLIVGLLESMQGGPWSVLVVPVEQDPDVLLPGSVRLEATPTEPVDTAALWAHAASEVEETGIEWSSETDELQEGLFEALDEAGTEDPHRWMADALCDRLNAASISTAQPWFRAVPAEDGAVLAHASATGEGAGSVASDEPYGPGDRRRITDFGPEFVASFSPILDTLDANDRERVEALIALIEAQMREIITQTAGGPWSSFAAHTAGTADTVAPLLSWQLCTDADRAEAFRHKRPSDSDRFLRCDLACMPSSWTSDRVEHHDDPDSVGRHRLGTMEIVAQALQAAGVDEFSARGDDWLMREACRRINHDPPPNTIETFVAFPANTAIPDGPDQIDAMLRLITPPALRQRLDDAGLLQHMTMDEYAHH